MGVIMAISLVPPLFQIHNLRMWVSLDNAWICSGLATCGQGKHLLPGNLQVWHDTGTAPFFCLNILSATSFPGCYLSSQAVLYSFDSQHLNLAVCTPALENNSLHVAMSKLVDRRGLSREITGKKVLLSWRCKNVWRTLFGGTYSDTLANIYRTVLAFYAW